MKVLQLTISFVEGGRRRAMTTLMKELRSLGVDSDLACVRDLGCSPEDAKEVAGAVEVLGQRSVIDRRAVGRLRDFCRDRQIDVIHTHDAVAQFVGAQMRLLGPRVPLLMTFHRSLGFESARRRDKLRNAFASSLSGAIVTGSRERREHFLQENFVSRAKLVRIPFGIDTNRFRSDPAQRIRLRAELGINSETLIIGAVGHFREIKGIDLVIQAFQEFSRRNTGTPAILVVVGDGPPERREFLAQLATSGPGRVVFAGFHRDVERWFQGFDLFVHGARQEAFGLVLAEAMSSGLPIVAPNVGGIPDVVRDGVTGKLVEPDDPTALAEGVALLIGRPDTRERMSREAQRIASIEFTGRRYAERHVQLYRSLISGRMPSGPDVESESVANPTDTNMSYVAATASSR